MMSNELNGLDRDVAQFFVIVFVAGLCAWITYMLVGE